MKNFLMIIKGGITKMIGGLLNMFLPAVKKQLPAWKEKVKANIMAAVDQAVKVIDDNDELVAQKAKDAVLSYYATFRINIPKELVSFMDDLANMAAGSLYVMIDHADDAAKAVQDFLKVIEKM